MHSLKLIHGSALAVPILTMMVGCNPSSSDRKAQNPQAPVSATIQQNVQTTPFDEAFKVVSGLKDRQGRYLLGAGQASDTAKEIVARGLDLQKFQNTYHTLDGLQNPTGRRVLESNDLQPEVLKETLLLAGTSTDLNSLKENLSYFQTFKDTQGNRLLDDKTAYMMAKDLALKEKPLANYIDTTNQFLSVRATPASTRPLLTRREALKVSYASILNPKFSMEDFDVEVRKLTAQKSFQESKRADQRLALRNVLKKMNVTY